MMKCKRLHVFFLVSLWVLCKEKGMTSDTSDSLIVKVPTNQTVPINSTAIFVCKVTGILVWEIAGQDITSDRQNAFCRERGVCVNGTLDNSPDETTQSVLLVTAIEENNNSMIRCLASESEFSEAEASNTVILKIFDRPALPTDLLSSSVSHLHLNLSWDAPFIFPGSKINYTVTIRNVNTSEEIHREGLEVTYYIFSGTEGSSMCDVYQFSVVAVNSAGRSDESETISRSLPTLPSVAGTTASLKHEIVFTSGQAAIFISFQPAESCPDYPVTSYSVLLHNDSTDAVIGPFDLPGSGRVEVQLTTAEGIRENERYNFSIIATNSIGSIALNKTEFFTTDVQSALVMSENTKDDVFVICQFAEGTQALGCHIEFRLSMPNITVTLNIPRQTESLEATSETITLAYPLVCYEVCAFDWESDGTRGELCVPVRVEQSQSGDAQCTDSGNGTSKQSLAAILGGAVGGAVLVLIILLIAVVIMRVKVLKKTKPGTLEMSTNPAYEITTIRAGRSTESTTFGVNSNQGTSLTASMNDKENTQQIVMEGYPYNHDEKFDLEVNMAYMTVN